VIVQWGSFVHADGSVAARIEVLPQRAEGNQYHAFILRWTLTGRIDANTQALLVAAIKLLEAAYSQDNQNLTLFQNDGITVAASIVTAATIGGTRVVSGPIYYEDGQRDAEFSTFRRFQIVIEALVSTGTVQLLAWAESVGFKGTGGPRFVMRQPLIQLPQKQPVAQATPIRALQRGRAIGWLDWPAPAPPQWPEHFKEDESEVLYNEPKRYGPPGAPMYVEFETTWSYVFEGAGPFVGRPTLWPQ
jgi:hypothetical protein